jgi:glycosyltransferase involved in cell wall biosynthesis
MNNVSIITINLNNRNGLEKTIASVIQQTYSDFEFIVIDGGSTDGSVDIIKKYQEKITYSISEKDNGIYNAMNKGILKATGNYCLFLNSGDFLYDKSVLQNFFFTEQAEDFIYGDLEFDYDKHKEIAFTPRLMTTYYVIKGSFWHQATFIKRKLFDEIGMYDETYKFAGDFDFFLKAIVVYHKSTKYINQVVSTYNLKGISNQSIYTAEALQEIETSRKTNIDTRVLEVFDEMILQINQMTQQINELQYQNTKLNQNFLEVMNSRPVKIAKFIRKLFRVK